MADIYSPLRRTAPGIYDGAQPAVDEAAILEATTPRANAFERGLRSTMAGMSAGSFANDALQAELRGDPAAAAAAQAESQRGLRAASQLAPLNDYRQVQGVGDAVDYGAGALGSAAASMAPVFAGGLAGRVLGPAGLRGLSSLAGAAVPGYLLGKGEAVANQYADPEIAALPAEQRDATAMATGAASAALDALVPGGAAARLGRRTAGGTARQLGQDALVEGATEMAQTGVGQYALGTLNPARDTAEDRPELINAALQGAIGGAGMSAVPAAVEMALPPAAPAAGAAPARSPLMDRLSPTRDVPPAGSPIDATASTADIAAQVAAQDSAPAQSFTPERLQQMGAEAVDDVAERVRSMLPETTAKRSDLFESVDPEDMTAARELLLKHIDPARVSADNAGNLQTALSMILAAFKRPDAMINDQALHRLGSSVLFDHARDPDALIADIAERVGDPKADRFGSVRTAERDVRKANNFLAANLTTEMRAVFTGERLRALARTIDEFVSSASVGRQDGPGKRPDKFLGFREELLDAFGTKQNVDNVLDYYSRGRKSETTSLGGDVRDAATALGDEEFLDSDFADEASTPNETGMSDQMREARNRYIFSDPKTTRPFVGKIDFEQLRATGRLGNRTIGNAQSVEGATMLDYVRDMGLDPAAEAERLFTQSEKAQKKADADSRSNKDPTYAEAARKRAQGHGRLMGVLETARQAGPVVDPETGEILSPAEVALSKLTLLRTKEYGGDDQTATPDDIGQMQRGLDAANNKSAALTFTDPDGKPVKLNARAMLKWWKRRGGTEAAGGESDTAYALRQFNSAVAAVVSAGYTLDRIPDELAIGQVGGVQRTFGELRTGAQAARVGRDTDPGFTTAPRSDFERELVGDGEVSIAERLQVLRDAAAAGDLDLVRSTEQEVDQAIRRARGALPKDAKDARGRLNAEAAAYRALFQDLAEDARGEDREGIVDAQVGGETLRGQDPQGRRIYQEETTESLQVMQDTARDGRKPKRVRPRDPERTAAKLAPATVKKTARSAASGKATGPAKQQVAVPRSEADLKRTADAAKEVDRAAKEQERKSDAQFHVGEPKKGAGSEVSNTKKVADLVEKTAPSTPAGRRAAREADQARVRALAEKELAARKKARLYSKRADARILVGLASDQLGALLSRVDGGKKDAFVNALEAARLFLLTEVRTSPQKATGLFDAVERAGVDLLLLLSKPEDKARLATFITAQFGLLKRHHEEWLEPAATDAVMSKFVLVPPGGGKLYGEDGAERQSEGPVFEPVSLSELLGPDVLKFVESPSLRAVAAAVARVAGDVPVTVSRDDNFYDPTSASITVGLSAGFATYVHEGVHAATLHALVKRPVLADIAYELMEHIATKMPGLAAAYGMSNTAEFFAEALTSPFLQQSLRAIPASASVRARLGNVRTAWDALVRVMRRALGMSATEENALSQMVDLTGALMQGTAQRTGALQLTEKEVRAYVNRAPEDAAVDVERYGKALLARLDAADVAALKYEDDYAGEFVDDQMYVSLKTDEMIEHPERINQFMLMRLAHAVAEPDIRKATTLFEHAVEPDSAAGFIPAEERFSLQGFTKKRQKHLTQAERAEIIAEIARLRGPQVKVVFERMAGAGSWEKVQQNNVDVEIIKIAVNIGAGNARDVAQHEALHSLFSTLRSPNSSLRMLEMAATLERVATSPAMQKKLADLLQGHPAALKQARNDPEEAAAYMYQFWQAGRLIVPPAMGGVFKKIADFIRGVFGIVSREEKAVLLMSAFRSGRLADPSTVSAVLEDMREKTLDERARMLLGPIYHVGAALLTSTTDRLRATKVPALRKLADEFHIETDVEGGRLSFLQKRAMSHNKAVARLNTAFVGVDKVTEREALEALQSRTVAKSPRAEKLRQDLRDYLDRMHDALTDAGVKSIVYRDAKDAKGNPIKVKDTFPLRKVKDYFPRAWDRDYIQRNEADFRAALGKYMTPAGVDEVFASVAGDDKVEIADGASYTPYFRAASEVKLTFITAANAHEFARFQQKDLKGVLSSYTYQATHRAEYARRFGNEGERIEELIGQARKQGASPDNIKMAYTAVEALSGTLGHDMNPKLRDLMVNVMTYQNVALLPFALINNFMDVVGVGVRSNDMTQAWNAMKVGLKGLYDQVRRNDPDDAQKLAGEIGLIDDVTAIGTYGYAYEGAFMKGLSRKVSDTFFRLNGMQTWNTRIRVAAMMSAQNFIVKHAAEAAKGDAKSLRFLKELNLTPRAVKLKADGTLRVLTRDGLTPMAATQMQEAIFRFVDGAAVRPNAAHRPIWGSDPRYMLLFHLKQFTFSFQQVVLRYANKEAEHENLRPAAALMSYVPFAIFTDTFKSLLLGRPVDTSLSGLIATAAKQSALVGTGTFGIDAFSDLSKNSVPGASFAGPTAGHVIQTLQTLSGSPNDSYTNLLLRSLPAGPVFRAGGLGS